MASNYYEILGVSPSASTSDIRAAYRQRVKKYHPDTSDYIDSETIFKQLKTGYDVLGNRERRSEYNQLGHDRFVEKHGGYTQSEIKEATETQIQVQSNPQRDATDDWQAEQQRRMQEQRTAADSISIFRRLLDFVIQGRTASTNDTIALIIQLVRLAIYAILIGVVAVPVAFLTGTFSTITSSFILFAIVLVVSRFLYLIGFEYLRSEYIKIDINPEPDAYTIPYALGLAAVGVLGVAILGVMSIVVQGDLSGPTFVIVLFNLLCAGTIPFSLVWTISSVGFGVADDRYNLQYDVSPVWWNFAVQTPVLIAFAAFRHLSIGYLVTICCLSSVVATVYLIWHHQEVGSEFRWRISNRRVFAGR